MNENRSTILYRDDRIVVIDKPPGVLVHRNGWEPEAPTCVHNLAGRLGRRVYNVHRLDRGTSGILVFALDGESSELLARQFRERRVEKRYIALVRGHCTETRRIDTPITDRRGRSRPAVTTVRPLSRTVVPEPVGPFSEAWFSLVELEIETGRHHQARRHLNYIAHPVIGDKQHGDSRNNRFITHRYGRGELLLRAVELRFDHPENGRRMRGFAGLPDWWRDLLHGIRLEPPRELLEEPGVRFHDSDRRPARNTGNSV